MGKVVSINKKNEELSEMMKLALSLSRQDARNVLLDALVDEYSIDLETRDIFEAYMIDCATVASDIVFMRFGDKVKIEQPIFKSSAVVPKGKEFELRQLALDELMYLKNTKSPIIEELSMYTTLFLELREARTKQENKIKSDLLSDKNLKELKKYFKEQGVEFNKNEVKKTIKDMIKDIGIVELLEKNYINIEL